LEITLRPSEDLASVIYRVIGMECKLEDLGLVDYQPAWELQETYAAEIAAGKRPPTLLLLEHPHVYTFGRRGQAENLLMNEAELRDRQVAVRWVDRGGDVTYHGPGQLVGYPLIPLGQVDAADKIPQADYVGYVRKLERVLITALARLGLATGQRKGVTGVWVQADVWSRCPRCRPEDRQKSAKVAAIGVKVDARGISRHGFALNVNPDMSYWDGIIACGLADEPVAALSDLLKPLPEMEGVKKEVSDAFGEVFGYTMK
jgi:lipoate-protein ligase B